MNDNLKKFIDKYCIKCKEPCEKGIYISENYLKCADTGNFKKIKKKVLTNFKKSCIMLLTNKKWRCNYEYYRIIRKSPKI